MKQRDIRLVSRRALADLLEFALGESEPSLGRVEAIGSGDAAAGQSRPRQETPEPGGTLEDEQKEEDT